MNRIRIGPAGPTGRERGRGLPPRGERVFTRRLYRTPTDAQARTGFRVRRDRRGPGVRTSRRCSGGSSRGEACRTGRTHGGESGRARPLVAGARGSRVASEAALPKGSAVGAFGSPGSPTGRKSGTAPRPLRPWSAQALPGAAAAGGRARASTAMAIQGVMIGVDRGGRCDRRGRRFTPPAREEKEHDRRHEEPAGRPVRPGVSGRDAHAGRPSRRREGSGDAHQADMVNAHTPAVNGVASRIDSERPGIGAMPEPVIPPASGPSPVGARHGVSCMPGW